MPKAKPANIQPKRILVITLRYLGDTLLTTPLLNALHQAYPQAAIDVLLPAANAGMLAGNPAVAQIVEMPVKPKLWTFLRFLAGLYRRYDWAIAAQDGDRPALCAIIAGKRSLGFVPEALGKAWWKKLLFSDALVFPRDYRHPLLENLRFCEVLGVEPCYRLTPPCSDQKPPVEPLKPYAVLHIMPQWRYKQWHSAGWRALIDYLTKSGLQVVLSGSGHPAERQVLNEIVADAAAVPIDVSGRLSLAQLADLIGGAALFVGPDTGITHMAAATGTPTIALFGPTDPRKWAPWPVGYENAQAPFAARGSRRVGNVYLIQGHTDKECLPCQLEGCERHRNSHSECLDDLPVQTVIRAVDEFISQAKSSRENPVAYYS
ncbi:glycosyltransferase family 9 protein [Methylomonas sp. HYX-M1]|uniref:glycosyltransferase family 9 protein n=1 Tax=Methylomonas sp. HYX-M1 TaxID=3139307 RepID=UPI00345C006C